MVREKKGRGSDQDFKQNGQRQPYTASRRRQRGTQAANGGLGLDVDKAQSSHSLPVNRPGCRTLLSLFTLLLS